MTRRPRAVSASVVVTQTKIATRTYFVTEDSTTLIDQSLDALGRVKEGCTIVSIQTIFLITEVTILYLV